MCVNDLTGRRPHRKIFSQEEDLTGRKLFIGRQSHWKTNSLKMISQEYDFKGRQPQMKTTKEKDNFRGRPPKQTQ